MSQSELRQIFEDDHYSLAQADFCNIPGYLILRFRCPAESYAELPAEQAAGLGPLLKEITAAVEAITGADRVYSLSFCEVDRRLHLHLFPRTPWLLDAYQEDTNTESEPANGALLFEWARARYAVDLNADMNAEVLECCKKLRRRLQNKPAD